MSFMADGGGSKQNEVEHFKRLLPEYLARSGPLMNSHTSENPVGFAFGT